MVGYKLSGGKSSKVLEVFADTEEGINADHLAEISRALTGWLDTTEVFPGDYRLMVSSPGLDSPLLFGWQYRRHRGKTVHIVCGKGEHAEEIQGTIQRVDTETVTVAVRKAERDIPFHSITTAKIVPSLSKRSAGKGKN